MFGMFGSTLAWCSTVTASYVFLGVPGTVLECASDIPIAEEGTELNVGVAWGSLAVVSRVPFVDFILCTERQIYSISEQSGHVSVSRSYKDHHK
jgi:hypothetical protein